jgi:hypothetical protein
MKRLLLVLLLATPVFADPYKRDWLEAFQNSDPTTTALRIKYRSDGCFRAVDYEFTFRFLSGSGPKVSVIENVHQSAKGITVTPVAQVKIGTLTLNAYDAGRFSKLLDYYNTFGRSETIFTTVDHVIFEKVTDGKAVVLAEIEDSSGRLLERPDVMTLDEIVDRIRPANRQLPKPDDPVPSAHPK